MPSVVADIDASGVALDDGGARGHVSSAQQKSWQPPLVHRQGQSSVQSVLHSITVLQDAAVQDHLCSDDQAALGWNRRVGTAEPLKLGAFVYARLLQRRLTEQSC